MGPKSWDRSLQDPKTGSQNVRNSHLALLASIHLCTRGQDDDIARGILRQADTTRRNGDLTVRATILEQLGAGHLWNGAYRPKEQPISCQGILKARDTLAMRGIWEQNIGNCWYGIAREPVQEGLNLYPHSKS